MIDCSVSHIKMIISMGIYALYGFDIYIYSHQCPLASYKVNTFYLTGGTLMG